MPLEYTEQVWRSLYKRWSDEHGGHITYSRAYLSIYPDHWWTSKVEVIKHLAPDAKTVLVVGCGFGDLIAALRKQGYNAWGVDGSEWVIARLREESVAAKYTVKSFVGVNTNTRTALMLAGAPAHYDVVVSEDVISGYADDELDGFFAAMERLGDTVMHIVTPVRDPLWPGDTGINWKTGEEWKKTNEDHIWIDVQTAEVI